MDDNPFKVVVTALDDHIVHSCLGNSNSIKLHFLGPALLPFDSSEVVEAVLLDFSGTLVPPRIDAM